MKISLLIAFLLSLLPRWLPAQSGYLYRYGTSAASECIAAVAPGSNGKALAAGAFTSGGNMDGLLMLVNAGGTLQSSRRMIGPGSDSFADVMRTADGAFVAVGATNSFGAGLSDGWIMKVNSSGVPLWRRTFGSPQDEHFVKVVQTKDRGYVVLGDTSSAGTGNDLILVKFNQVGGVMWMKTLATAGFDHASGLAATADGGVLVSSNTDRPDGKTVALLTHFTAPGGILWSRSISSSYNFHAGASVMEAADGTIFLLQYVAPAINVNSRAVLTHLSFSGNMLWSRIIRFGNAPLAIFSAVLAPDGGVILGGTTGLSPTRGVILKIDFTGKLLWKKALQLAGASVAINSISLSSGGDSVLAAACVSSTATTDFDAALLQLPANGNSGGCGALPEASLAVSSFGVTIAANSFTQPGATYLTSTPAVTTSGVSLPSGRVCSSQ